MAVATATFVDNGQIYAVAIKLNFDFVEMFFTSLYTILNKRSLVEGLVFASSRSLVLNLSPKKQF